MTQDVSFNNRTYYFNSFDSLRIYFLYFINFIYLILRSAFYSLVQFNLFCLFKIEFFRTITLKLTTNKQTYIRNIFAQFNKHYINT